MRLALVIMLSWGCGAEAKIDSDRGADAGQDADAGSDPECTDDNYVTITLENGPEDRLSGEVGAIADQELAVKAVLPDGTPVAVEWTADDGFAFPIPMDEDGVSAAAWVFGSAAEQTLSASAPCGPPLAITASVSPRQTRANSVHFWFQTGVYSDYSVEVEPVTDPANTYYAALGFDGGYAGLQPETSLIGERAVLFSVWDVDGEDAELIDQANSTLCQGFGNEGTGIQCWFPYEWQTGKSYRFELEARLEDDSNPDYTDYTAYFTDVENGTRTKLATLRYGKAVNNDYMYGFAEDYGPESAHCLATSQRTVVFRNSRARLGDGAWQDIGNVNFTQYHPRSYCANVAGELSGTDGFLLSTGGELVGGPEATSVALP